MNYLIIIVVLFVLVIGTELFRRASLNKLLKELYNAAYVAKDGEGFELLIQSPQAKMLMNDATRQLMRLNYYIASDQMERVLKCISKVKKLKLNTANKKAFYASTIGYLSEKQNKEAVALLELMKSDLNDANDAEAKMLLFDCELTVDIYIHENLNRIKDLEEILQADLDPNAKSIYQYRLAKLYKAANKKDKCKEMLKESLNNTSSGQAKKKINEILKGRWELL